MNLKNLAEKHNEGKALKPKITHKSVLLRSEVHNKLERLAKFYRIPRNRVIEFMVEMAIKE